jgi:hypothetical protein
MRQWQVPKGSCRLIFMKTAASAMAGKTDILRMCYDEGVRVVVALYVAAMVALIVGVDVTLFRHHFWERLAANVGIVLLFAAFYFRFLRV